MRWRSGLALLLAVAVAGASLGWLPGIPRPAAAQEQVAAVLWARGVAVSDLAWSPDGQRLAAATDQGVLILDAGGQLLHFIPLPGATLVAWSSRGELAAVSDDEDHRTPSRIHVFAADEPGYPARAAWDADFNTPPAADDLAWSPDGEALAVAQARGGIWSETGQPVGGILLYARTGELLWSVPAEQADAEQLAWDPAGQYLVGIDDNRLTFYRRSDGGVERVLQPAASGHDPGSLWYVSVAYSPDGSRIALGLRYGRGTGRAPAYLYVLDAATGQLSSTYGPWWVGGSSWGLQSVSWRADGRAVAGYQLEERSLEFSYNSYLRFVALQPGGPALPPVPSPTALTSAQTLAWSPTDPSRLAVGVLGGLWLWDGSAWRNVLQGHAGHATAAAWDPRGEFLVTGGRDGKVRVWSGREGAMLGEASLGGEQVHDLAFAPGQRLLAAGTAAGRVHFFAVDDSGRPAPQGSPLQAADSAVRALRFLPDGRLAVATDGNGVLLWRAREDGSWQVDRTVTSLAARSLAASPDGGLLAVGPSDGRAALVYDLATGQQVASLWVPSESPVWGFTFVLVDWSADGRYLAAGLNEAGDRVGLWEWDGRQFTLVRAFPVWEGTALALLPSVPAGPLAAAPRVSTSFRILAPEGTLLASVRRNQLTDVLDLAWHPSGLLAAVLEEGGVLAADLASLVPPPDTRPPQVVSRDPTGEGVLVDAGMVLTFDEPVRPVAGKRIALHRAEDGALVEEFPVDDPQRVDVRGNRVSFRPAQPLAYETEYYVLVEEGAFRDLSGNLFPGLTDPEGWRFTTEPRDTQPPAVTSSQPAPGATGVDLEPTIVLTFGERIYAGPQLSAVRLQDAQGGSVPVSVDLGDTELAVSPQRRLAPLTAYTLQLPEGAVRDRQGNANAAFSLSFTTGEGPPPPPPPYYRVDDQAPFAWREPGPDAQVLEFSSDDDGVASLDLEDLGFELVYYGERRSTLYVGTNGILGFDAQGEDDAYTEYSGEPLPAEDYDYTLVAPLWMDLLLTGDATVTAHVYDPGGDAPRELVITYRDVWNYGEDGTVRFQVIFPEGRDEVIFQYADVVFDDADPEGDGLSYGIDAVVGVQRDAAQATLYSAFEPSLRDGLALRFFRASEPLSVLTASLPEATAGSPYSVTLQASGGTPPYTWSLAEGSSLPPGLALAPDGTLSGTPSESGSFTFTVRVQDASSPPQSATATLALAVRATPAADSEPPAVRSTVPAPGATGVPVDTVLSVTFSEPVRPGSQFGGIALRDGQGETVAAQLSLQGETLMVDPAADLAPGTAYALTLPAGAVEDLAGNPLAEAFTLSFTTAPAASAQRSLRFLLPPPSALVAGEPFRVRVAVYGSDDQVDTAYRGTLRLELEGAALAGGPLQRPVEGGVAEFADVRVALEAPIGDGFVLRVSDPANPQLPPLRSAPLRIARLLFTSDPARAGLAAWPVALPAPGSPGGRAGWNFARAVLGMRVAGAAADGEPPAVVLVGSPAGDMPPAVDDALRFEWRAAGRLQRQDVPSPAAAVPLPVDLPVPPPEAAEADPVYWRGVDVALRNAAGDGYGVGNVYAVASGGRVLLTARPGYEPEALPPTAVELRAASATPQAWDELEVEGVLRTPLPLSSLYLELGLPAGAAAGDPVVAAGVRAVRGAARTEGEVRRLAYTLAGDEAPLPDGTRLFTWRVRLPEGSARLAARVLSATPASGLFVAGAERELTLDVQPRTTARIESVRHAFAPDGRLILTLGGAGLEGVSAVELVQDGQPARTSTQVSRRSGALEARFEAVPPGSYGLRLRAGEAERPLDPTGRTQVAVPPALPLVELEVIGAPISSSLLDRHTDIRVSNRGTVDATVLLLLRFEDWVRARGGRRYILEAPPWLAGVFPGAVPTLPQVVAEGSPDASGLPRWVLLRLDVPAGGSTAFLVRRGMRDLPASLGLRPGDRVTPIWPVLVGYAPAAAVPASGSAPELIRAVLQAGWEAYGGALDALYARPLQEVEAYLGALGRDEPALADGLVAAHLHQLADVLEEQLYGTGSTAGLPGGSVQLAQAGAWDLPVLLAQALQDGWDAFWQENSYLLDPGFYAEWGKQVLQGFCDGRNADALVGLLNGTIREGTFGLVDPNLQPLYGNQWDFQVGEAVGVAHGFVQREVVTSYITSGFAEAGQQIVGAGAKWLFKAAAGGRNVLPFKVGNTDWVIGDRGNGFYLFGRGDGFRFYWGNPKDMPRQGMIRLDYADWLRRKEQLDTAREWFARMQDAYRRAQEAYLGRAQGCPCAPPGEARFSYDPNELAISPSGLAPEGWLTGQERLLFRIDFENLGNDPAKDVRVELRLDEDLDERTLRLEGSSHERYTVDPDAVAGDPDTPGNEYEETMRFSYDPATRTLTWLFPDIMLADRTQDDRNDGFVLFSVAPRAGAPHGAAIEGQAHIYFDFNPAVDTNVEVRRIDREGPAVQLEPLPATASGPVALRWSGSDEPGAGIRHALIWVSREGGPYELWRVAAPGEAPAFQGEVGVRYRFRVQGVDLLGHEGPLSAEREVRFVTAQAGGGGTGFASGPAAPPAAPVARRVQVALQPGAATVAELPGLARVEVPAGAVAGTGATLVLAEVAAAQAPPAPHPLLGEPVEVTLEGGQLAGRIRLVLRYDPATVPADHLPTVFFYDPATGRWQPLGGRVTPGRGEVAAEVDHLTLFALLAVPEPDFADLRGHWGRAGARALAARGVVAGYPDGSFGPERPVTRAEAAALLVRALGLAPAGAAEQAALAQAFADGASVPGWARSWLAAAVQAGLVRGEPGGDGRPALAPERPVTRAEMVALLARALRRAGGLTPAPAAPRFADEAEIPAWVREDLGLVAGSGLVHGYPDGSFRPGGAVTRAEAAAMLARWLVGPEIGAPDTGR